MGLCHAGRFSTREAVEDGFIKVAADFGIEFFVLALPPAKEVHGSYFPFEKFV